MHTRIRINKSV